MKRWLLSAALLIGGAACMTLGCGSDGPAEASMAKSDKPRVTSPQVAPQDLTTQVRGNGRFAVDLYHQIRRPGENLFASPHSISTALAMLYGGARGATEQQMQAALHLELPQAALHPVFNKLDLELASRGQGAQGSDGQPFELAVANSICGRPDGTYLPSYLDLLAQSYGAGIRLVDFGGDPEGARKEINAWVAARTRDRIKELLQQGQIDTSTALVLVNAIYFNAAWEEPFEGDSTAPHPFDADGSNVTVQMMLDLKKKSRYAAGDGYQAVDLPFDGEELSMLVIVPDAGTFGSFQQALSLETVEGVVGQLSPHDVLLQLPRFSFSARRELRAALEALGMRDAFDDGAANFEGICGVPGGRAGLVVKEVVHEAFVEVTEKGAEAAAATTVTMADAGVALPPEPIALTVDRPFLFLIRDRATGEILFLGHVVDPTT